MSKLLFFCELKFFCRHLIANYLDHKNSSRSSDGSQIKFQLNLLKNFKWYRIYLIG